MGDTISSLVFRPPKPTPIHPSEYFYLDVDVHSPLCTNKTHSRNNDGSNSDNNINSTNNCIGNEHHGGSCGSAMMCMDTGESDLATLDAVHGISKQSAAAASANIIDPVHSDDHHHNSPHHSNVTSSGPTAVNNVRNGQIYKIPAFFIRRRNAKQTLLFSHGNAEDLGMMYNRMKDLAMVLGVNIMAYDYTGYGLSIPGPAHQSTSSSHASSGSGNNNNDKNKNSNGGNNKNGSQQQEGPSENMIYRNIEAAFHYLTRVRKIPPHQIILYGRSLGSGPSCYLAAKTALNGASVGGLILHSPFLSVYKVVADLNGLDLGMVGDLFHNEKRAKNVRCPTLIIHGRQDEVVPFWHAQRLLAAVPPEFRAQPFYVDSLGHNHIESRCREQYVKVVLNFLRMGVWNNRNNNTTTTQVGVGVGGGGAQQQDGYNNNQSSRGSAFGSSPNSSSTNNNNRGPSPIPVHERASPSETKENASFYVNKTWLRHAKVLLKEVFADAGCYISTSSYHCDDNNSGTGSGSHRQQQQRASAAAAVGSSATTSSRSSSNRNGNNNGNDGLADARDDEQDEFAPWRGGGGANGNGNRPRSATGDSSANGSGSENRPSNAGGGSRREYSNQQQQQRQHRDQSEKILTTRRDNVTNNTKRPGSLSMSANTPRHDKYSNSKSMFSRDRSMDRSSRSIESDRRSNHSKQSNNTKQSSLLSRRSGRSYAKSKSMKLLEGMSRKGHY